LKRIDARLLPMFGFSMIAFGSWIDSGLTHDWVGEDFRVSQLIEAVGLAFAITALLTFGLANITPPQAAAIGATIQIARWLGSEIGSAVIQTFVRVREQVDSNLIGLHVVAGLPATEQTTTQLAGPFDTRAIGLGDPAAQAAGVLADFVGREAYVLAYIDAFWLIAWVSLLGILLILLLRPAPPNLLIPSREGHEFGRFWFGRRHSRLVREDLPRCAFRSGGISRVSAWCTCDGSTPPAFATLPFFAARHPLSSPHPSRR